MKLTRVQISNFQSIQDSTEFEVGDVTCLVGKNEAGKTAILKALYQLNPVNTDEGVFDYVMDYPRKNMADYENAVEVGEREHAKVVQATYVLDRDDIVEIGDNCGIKWATDQEAEVILTKGYDNELAIESSFDTHLGDDLHLCHQILQDRIPKFLYFDEYYLMEGQASVAGLKQRVENNNLRPSDKPLLGLIELAGLDLNLIEDTKRTEALFGRLESAANSITQKILPYWSQNTHIRIKCEILEARPGDPPGMRKGKNIWTRVENTKHMVTTAIGTRSRGFVWFFSFLAWYSQLRQQHNNLILLLDEPGLFLHAKAQADLLNYFEKELSPHHQLVYTTHSPFMVDPAHFDRVRIVQDQSIESQSTALPSEEHQGTEIVTDVLQATQDSLFPLQGALGYEIYQTLFVGPNCLVVEGVSDLLYIQTISGLLQRKGKSGLSEEWIVTPVGGFDKVPTFVALIGAQTNLNLAVLIDYQEKDRQVIENLYKKRLLKEQSVYTYADYVSGNEADIEDMFDVEFYLEVVNAEFKTRIAVDKLLERSPRIIKRLEQYFEDNPLADGVSFNHYRPARYLSVNIASLECKLAETQLDRFQKVFDDLNKLL